MWEVEKRKLTIQPQNGGVSGTRRVFGRPEVAEPLPLPVLYGLRDPLAIPRIPRDPNVAGRVVAPSSVIGLVLRLRADTQVAAPIIQRVVVGVVNLVAGRNLATQERVQENRPLATAPNRLIARRIP